MMAAVCTSAQKKTRPSIRHGTSVVWKFVPGSCGGAWGVRSGGYPVLTTISPWLKKWNTESLPSKTIVTSEISKIQIFYMEASQNSDTPNHPSHQWPQYSIEPHGDLGILHFRTPPLLLPYLKWRRWSFLFDEVSKVANSADTFAAWAPLVVPPSRHVCGLATTNKVIIDHHQKPSE